jgi:HlyD family secretion protein
VAGQITRFGVDLNGKRIDYNSPVEVGTVLAVIDPTVYKARVEQETAGLRRAQAELKLAEAKAKDQTPEVGKASLEGAKASVQQSQSALALAISNLDYTTITSPVKGVIIDRRVNVGQNVAAGGPNGSSLFLIAKDIKKMQVWASVNEADVARIRKGMEARFSVDAFPKETFKGTVSQIRMNAAMSKNFVTYTVVIAFENPDLKLMPYLTANLKFQGENHTKVLLVPNAALNWQPGLGQVAPEVHGVLAATNIPGNRGVVWVKTADGQHVRPVEVQIVARDNKMFEVSGKEVKEGMEIVVGEQPTAP